MYQPPGAGVPLGVESATIVRVVVLGETAGEVAGMSDVDLTLRVQQNIDRVTHEHI